ncbi:MAG: DUF6174 domain-containing protein [Gemmatimonadaceae bacterium]
MDSLTRRAVTSALVVLAAGCGLITGSDDEVADDLRRAQNRWNRSGVQDYQIVVQNLCFCGYTRPVRITVRFGNVVSKVDAETGEPAPSYANAREVARLFDLVREVINQGADRIEVAYDATYGFPTRIDIDYIRNAVDDELQVRTSDFQPMR